MELAEAWQFAVVTVSVLLQAAAVVGVGRGHLKWTVEHSIARRDIVGAHADGHTVEGEYSSHTDLCASFPVWPKDRSISWLAGLTVLCVLRMSFVSQCYRWSRDPPVGP